MNLNQKQKNIKARFDEACKELISVGVSANGESNFYIQVYTKMFGEYPNVFSIELDGFYLNPNVDQQLDRDDEYDENVDVNEVDNTVFTYANYNASKTHINFYEHFKDKAYIIRNDEFPTIISEKLFIIYDTYLHYTIVLCDQEEMPEELKEHIATYDDEDSEKRWYNYITTSSGGFNSTALSVKKQDVNLTSNYNDDLPHEKIVDFLKSDQSGLLLLHGNPGTGKTSYIRNLMYEIKGRPFMVLDNNVFNYITDSSFVNLLLNNRQAIIILEDCESMLEDRSTGNNQLSTLLNLSDGILGDSFKFKFICTFNAKVSDIDKAVLRKGRMKVKYEFKPLTAEKTKAKAQELGIDVKDGETLTLAELYNYAEQNDLSSSGSKKIGFSK